MGFIFSLIKRLIVLAIYVVLLIAILTVIPNLPPYTHFTSIELAPTLERVGPLKSNNELNNAKQLYNNKLSGPEAFQLHNGEVYTSLATGEIVKLSSGGHVTFVTKIGKPCEGIYQEHICGRPLGFVIDSRNEKLIVADAYYGIWQVDLKTDKKQLLVSPETEIDGRAPKFFNSVAVAKNGDIYWTDSSSDFQLKNGVGVMFSDPSGRLFHYDPKTKRSKVLVDGLWFANGLAISPDDQFIVVAESSGLRLMKHYIDGPKKGKTEVFLAGLPGIPDNVRALPDGSGLLVGLFEAYGDEDPILLRSVSKAPIIRKFLARLVALIDAPLELLQKQIPHPIIQSMEYYVGSFRSISGMKSGISGLLQIDWNGNVVASYYNTDGTLKHVSDAIVFQDNLLIGSPHGHDFVGAVPAPPLLKKAFASVKSATPKPVEPATKPPKPTEAPKPATPKPTPAPPKPTEAPKPKQAPKPAEAPEPKVQEKPKEEVKREAPKAAKPVAQEPPKQAKPAEPVKVSTPKLEEKKPTPTQQPKKTPQEQVKSTPPPPKATPPKQEKAAPTPKPATKSNSEPKQQAPKDSPTPKEIPIKEEIPSDTVKPSKEKLKVIKRGGPTEIPNPNL